MYRLLITGSRSVTDAEFVWMPLWQMVHKHESLLVVHGDCPTGADKFAQDWVDLPGQRWNLPTRPVGADGKLAVDHDYLAVAERHPAKWDLHGKVAGPIRNQAMVNLGADACFAFPTRESRGTTDCMARAWVADIDVYVFNTDTLGAFHKLSDKEGDHLARRHKVGQYAVPAR